MLLICHFCIIYLYFHSFLHVSTSCSPDAIQLISLTYFFKWGKIPHYLIQTYHYAWKTLKNLWGTVKKSGHYWKSLLEQKWCTQIDNLQHARRNQTVFENNKEKCLTWDPRITSSRRIPFFSLLLLAKAKPRAKEIHPSSKSHHLIKSFWYTDNIVRF